MCACLCLSVLVGLESLDLQTSFLVCRYVFRISRTVRISRSSCQDQSDTSLIYVHVDTHIRRCLHLSERQYCSVMISDVVDEKSRKSNQFSAG